MTPVRLQLQAIEKNFSGARVLKEVSLTVRAGETLGLVGENGAGKSTLMNVLGGNLQPDSGQMLLDGELYAPRHAREAIGRGIAFVHQELNLFANLSIAENLFLNSFPVRLGRIDHRRAREQSAQLLTEVGLRLSPEALVETLSAGERQLVEIAKALSVDARILILDEPTSSLTAPEAEHLFGLLRSLQQRGLSMIYISHHLSEVFRLCQSIAVLRDGELVRSGPAQEFTLEQVIALMVGRNIQQMFPERSVRPSSEEVLHARHLGQAGVLKDVSFALHRHEVLGIAGLMGSGRSELARILFGLDPCQQGEVRLEGELLGRASPRNRIRRGLAFLTEDRREEGLCLEASIADNMALVSLPRLGSGPLKWIDGQRLAQEVVRMRQATRLSSSARDDQPVRTLSGGNQQKVVLAKWILSRPAVFILDEPTRGIDVGAKVEVYRLINELAAEGAGILMISSELEELIGLCDRILVMRAGEIRDELARSEFHRERILRVALGETG